MTNLDYQKLGNIHCPPVPAHGPGLGLLRQKYTTVSGRKRRYQPVRQKERQAQGRGLKFYLCISAVVNQITAKLKPGQTTPTMTLEPLLILTLMHAFHFFSGLWYLWLCSASLLTARCFTAELRSAAVGTSWHKQSGTKDLSGLVSSGRAYFHIQFSCQEKQWSWRILYPSVQSTVLEQ